MDSTTAPAEKPRPSFVVGRTVVYPSSTNPRSRFDEASLKELAASMAAPVGIIEPLVVRPHPSKGEGRYEIVAGERRWRAAGIAGLDEIPIIVRELDDAQVLDLQLIENKHRDDIHPLEEARAMERRIKLDRQLTPKGMAKFIGVSERYVQNRLRYLTLVGEAQQLFLNGELLSAHADLLIRLPPDLQRRAVKDGLYVDEWDGDKRVKVLSSARSFDEWLKQHMRLTPAEMVQTGLFPEVAAANAEPGVSTLVELVDYYTYDAKKGESKPLTTQYWEAIKPGKNDACEFQQRGVVVLGHTQGRILTVCTGYGKCKKHFAASISRAAAPRTNGGSSRPAPLKKSKYELEREQRRKLWDVVEKPVRQAIAAAAKTVKPTAAVLKFLTPPYEKRPYKSFGDFVAAQIDSADLVYDIDEAQKAAKVFGVDLKPILAAANVAIEPKKAKPAKKVAVKKAAKKTAGGRKKK